VLLLLANRLGLYYGSWEKNNRKYASLGDITVTVNKTTVFTADLTKEQVNQKLREKAAQLGADAVIFVPYDSGGVSLMNWGSLEGKVRAIKLQPQYLFDPHHSFSGGLRNFST